VSAATENDTTSPESTHRRSILAGIIAALASPAVAHASPADSTVTSSPDDGAEHPDAELFERCAEHAAAMQAYDDALGMNPSIPDEESAPLFEAYHDARRALVETQAQTMNGLISKARANVADLAFFGWNGEEDEESCRESIPLALSIMFDLVRLGDQVRA